MSAKTDLMQRMYPGMTSGRKRWELPDAGSQDTPALDPRKDDWLPVGVAVWRARGQWQYVSHDGHVTYVTDPITSYKLDLRLREQVIFYCRDCTSPTTALVNSSAHKNELCDPCFWKRV